MPQYRVMVLGDAGDVVPYASFYETNPFIRDLPWSPLRRPRLCCWRRNATSCNSGGLEALEFVQRLIEASLYRCFVAGELREGVSLVGTPDKVLPSMAVSVFCLAFHLLGSRECFLQRCS